MTTSSKKDYLSILGLPPDFDDKELKKAFRREARKWHPDLNKNDLNAEERFKLINEAYEYLRDPNVRKNSADENVHGDYENNNFKTGFPDFQDYLDSLFGYEYSPKNYEEYDDEPFEDESIITNNDEFNNWQFYIHHNQEDNLLAISGGRTFFLVNFGWDYPFYKVRLESCGYILRIPRGTFHRSVSDENGSIVLNQAIRDKEGTVESEFKVTNSKDNKRLLDCITNLEPRFKIYSVK